MGSKKINVYLDDMREPYKGWKLARTVEEAKELLLNNYVQMISLDHDLGACDKCNGRSAEAWLEAHDYKSMPSCEHVGTGYTLICWMEEMIHEGKFKCPKILLHTANPVGWQNMAIVARRIDETFVE